MCKEWTVKAWPRVSPSRSALNTRMRLYIARNDGEQYAVLTYSVFVSLSWYTTWMFVSGGSFILSSRTSSVKRPHQRSLAAAVLKETNKRWCDARCRDKADTSTVNRTIYLFAATLERFLVCEFIAPLKEFWLEPRSDAESRRHYESS